MPSIADLLAAMPKGAASPEVAGLRGTLAQAHGLLLDAQPGAVGRAGASV